MLLGSAPWMLIEVIRIGNAKLLLSLLFQSKCDVGVFQLMYEPFNFLHLEMVSHELTLKVLNLTNILLSRRPTFINL